MSQRIPRTRPVPSARLEALESRTLLSGTWTRLAQAPPNGLGTMNLLSDGSVIMADNGNHWSRLVPDINGSYGNGTY